MTKVREAAPKNITEVARATTGLQRLIEVLNRVVVTEMVRCLRYARNSIVTQGIDREQMTAMFREHAGEEPDHFRRVFRTGSTSCAEVPTWIRAHSSPVPSPHARSPRKPVFRE
ncbi:hypothetical protein AB0M87_18220 [Streptomyces sp. NPDC051320]|uniref:hypothetical protein n=1 Tax=Streptomyces sp. NPDC051320 TaxID=3154644 RepID=UPI00344908EE